MRNLITLNHVGNSGNVQPTITDIALKHGATFHSVILLNLASVAACTRRAQRSLSAHRGRTINHDVREDLLYVMAAAHHDLSNARGCCFMCGAPIAADNSCSCFPSAKGVSLG